MKNKNFNSIFYILIALAIFSFSFSCKKKKDPRVPPELAFVTGAGYISVDKTVGLVDTLIVGITATRTEDKLNTFNVSYSYDGGASVSKSNENLFGSEEEGFSRSDTIITRNLAGTEKWIFTVTDLDGNITSKSITLTVK